MSREKDLSIYSRFRGKISLGKDAMLAGVRVRLLNKCTGEIQEISKKTSRTKVLIIPTNEELEIARQSFELIN